MSNVDEAASLNIGDGEARPAAKQGGSRLWLIVAAALLVGLGAGAGAWYLFLGGRGGGHAAQPPEAPMPFLLPVKPFVITVGSRAGPSHFVQLGVSLELPGQAAGDLVTAVLPKLQDDIRQTFLGFKSEDLQTPQGIDKARAAVVAHLNAVLPDFLGPERVAQANGGQRDKGLVRNIYFPTLVVE